MVSWRALVAGTLVEVVAVLVLVLLVTAVGLPGFYQPASPARLAPVLGGLAAGWWGLREWDGPGRVDSLQVATRNGAALAVLTGGGAVVGLLLQSRLWAAVTLTALVVFGAAWRDGDARLAATAAFVAVLTILPRLRVGLGTLLTAASLWPRMGAYAFLAPRPGLDGWLLLALALVGHVLGGVIAGVWARRRDGKALSRPASGNR
ncbi:hypothetical protein [Haloarchaeobius amylolyticus]|uniref:hypothetical protein n=1 Tax=Haloarchaeobius amylolyticus TaxID=1198296 RepID=UPI002270BA37|nr:hypothetical protein [Haloarchaeobius amylolyticus]